MNDAAKIQTDAPAQPQTASWAQEVRIFFAKTGRTRYISHLDLNRLMQRTIKRAGLPVWYTEGFHPHLYITFALPLSLGYESDRESMDLRLTKVMPYEEIIHQMNAYLPEGLRVVDAAPPVMKPATIQKALYHIELESDSYSPAALHQAFAKLLSGPELLVEKKSKKGLQTIDIKPMVEFVSSSIVHERLELALILPAGITKNLNPTLLTDALNVSIDRQLTGIYVTRKRILCENGLDFA